MKYSTSNHNGREVILPVNVDLSMLCSKDMSVFSKSAKNRDRLRESKEGIVPSHESEWSIFGEAKNLISKADFSNHSTLDMSPSLLYLYVSREPRA